MLEASIPSLPPALSLDGFEPFGSGGHRHRCAHPKDPDLFDLWVSVTARRLRPVQVLPGSVRQRLTEFESDLNHVRKENPRFRGIGRFRRYLTVMPLGAVVKGQPLTGYASRMPMDFADRRHAA